MYSWTSVPVALNWDANPTPPAISSSSIPIAFSLARIWSLNPRCTGCTFGFWKPMTSTLNIRPTRLVRAVGVFMDSIFPMKFCAVCIGTMRDGF